MNDNVCWNGFYCVDSSTEECLLGVSVETVAIRMKDDFGFLWLNARDQALAQFGLHRNAGERQPVLLMQCPYAAHHLLFHGFRLVLVGIDGFYMCVSISTRFVRKVELTG